MTGKLSLLLTKLHGAKMQNTKKLLHRALNILTEIVISAALITGSFISGKWYERYQIERTHAPNYSIVIRPHQVSVSIDQNNRLIILNKTTNEPSIFSDSITTAIFTLYANQLVNTQTKTK